VSTFLEKAIDHENVVTTSVVRLKAATPALTGGATKLFREELTIHAQALWGMIAAYMTITQNRKELFEHTTIMEIVSMFQSLLDTRDIAPEEALALAGAIHAGLRNPQGWDGSIYARYAQMMALLRYGMPEIHEHVVADWQLHQPCA